MKGNRIRVVSGLFLLLCIMLLGVHARGAANIQSIGFTASKGKSAKIKNIMGNNFATKELSVNQFTWKSKNPKIVRVGKGATITALKKGTAYVEGNSKKGKKNRVRIKVTVGNPTNRIEVEKGSYTKNIGQTIRLSAKVKPANATNKKVIYQSDNPGVAKVDAGGRVVCLSSGKANIRIYAKDSCSKASVSIVVNPQLVKQTTYGWIEGLLPDNGTSVAAWLGVPYASPPIGELRWKAPRDPESWVGIRKTKDYAGKAAQMGSGGKLSGSEDCLYLNIYRPNSADVDLPVMVYLHGGGNVSGNSHKNFKNLSIATNSIIVSVEYRLGAFGWLNVPALHTGNPEEDSGNFALLDIKKALEWVRFNIEQFGGDNGNVTLTGFSAGARNTLACLASPIMGGLFHKAIVFSGGMATVTPEEGQESAYGKLAKILVDKGRFQTKKKAREWLNNASKEEWKEFLYGLSTYEVANMYKYFGLRMENAPQLFSDGYVLPKEGFQAVQEGRYHKVPVLLGSSSNEFATYALSAPYTESDDIMDAIRTGWDMFDMIWEAKDYGSKLQSGWYIEQNAEALVGNADQPKIYAYRFHWGNHSAITGDFYSSFIGSRHGIDLQFINGIWTNSFEEYASNLYNDGNYRGRKALSEKMQRYIANFLKKGNPNGKGLKTWNAWNRTTGKKKIMYFNANKNKDRSKMSAEYLDRDAILKRMKTYLPTAQYNILMDCVFKGRYFMPQEEYNNSSDGEALEKEEEGNDNLAEDIFKNED